jgi:Rrf2 family protein
MIPVGPYCRCTRMLSQKAKYALQALLVMAAKPGNDPVHIADIAASEGISRKFLEAILLDLRKQGVLTSRRGPGGGYSLARPADQIYFGEVIRVVDGPLAPLPCASVSAFRLCDDCADPRRCSIRWLMQRVRDATAGVLDSCTLADAVGKRPVNNRRNRTRIAVGGGPHNLRATSGSAE